MKNVTRITALILSVTIISSIFASCVSGDSNENTIVGKWEITRNGQTDVAEFLDNGKFYAKTRNFMISGEYEEESIPPDGVPITGDYIIDGDQLICEYQIWGAKQKSISTFTVNSTTLTLTDGGTETSGIKTVEITIMLKRVK